MTTIEEYIDINISVKNDTFSEDELKKLMQCIREIEQNKPERHINIWIDSPEKTTKEIKGVISSIKPALRHINVIELEKK